jgi:hypothetical protein
MIGHNNFTIIRTNIKPKRTYAELWLYMLSIIYRIKKVKKDSKGRWSSIHYNVAKLKTTNPSKTFKKLSHHCIERTLREPVLPRQPGFPSWNLHSDHQPDQSCEVMITWCNQFLVLITSSWICNQFVQLQITAY